jgi:hypothetical protein
MPLALYQQRKSVVQFGQRAEVKGLFQESTYLCSQQYVRAVLRY